MANSGFGNNSNGKRVCDIMHFYQKKRSNGLQVYIDDPYLKDGKWLTSGAIRIVMTKFNQHGDNQVNVIKLTFAEATELVFRIQKGLEEAFGKELLLQQ